MLRLFLLAALLASLVHGWCINSPRQLVDCTDFASSSTVGCYAYSQSAESYSTDRIVSTNGEMAS